MTWAPGGNALGGECPPAPAFGRRLLLYFAPKDIPTRVRLSRCFKGTKLEASLFRQPAIRRPGLRSRRTASHASAVRDVAPTYVGVAASSSMVVSGSPFDTMAAMPRSPVTLTTVRSEEHTSELQPLMRLSYAVFCLKKKLHLQ